MFRAQEINTEKLGFNVIVAGVSETDPLRQYVIQSFDDFFYSTIEDKEAFKKAFSAEENNFYVFKGSPENFAAQAKQIIPSLSKINGYDQFEKNHTYMPKIGDDAAFQSKPIIQSSTLETSKRDNFGRHIPGARRELYEAIQQDIEAFEAYLKEGGSDKESELFPLCKKDLIMKRLNFDDLIKKGVRPEPAYLAKLMQAKIHPERPDGVLPSDYIKSIILFNTSIDLFIEKSQDIEPDKDFNSNLDALYRATINATTDQLQKKVLTAPNIGFKGVAGFKNSYFSTASMISSFNTAMNKTSWESILQKTPRKRNYDPDAPRLKPPLPPYLEKIERTGDINFAAQEVISEKRICDEFGFSGVEYGNSLKSSQKEAQAIINFYFNGFKDLSKALSVAEDQVGLGGELAISTGARGHRSAAAHYDVANKLVHATRKNGPGKIAHEYGHALDYALGEVFKDNPYGEIPKFVALSEYLCSYVKAENVDSNSPVAKMMDSFMAIMDRAKSRPESYSDVMKEKIQEFSKSVPFVVNSLNLTPDLLKQAKSSGIDLRAEIADEVRREWIELLDVQLDTGGVSYESFKSNICIAVTEGVQAALGDDKLELSQSVFDNPNFDDNLKIYFDQKASIVELNENFHKELDLARAENPDITAATLVYDSSRKLDTDYIHQLELLDALGSKPYYTKNVEIWARVFETYVYERLSNLDIRNDFLAGPHLKEGYFEKSGFSGNPYPLDNDRKELVELVSNFVEEHLPNALMEIEQARDYDRDSGLDR